MSETAISRLYVLLGLKSTIGADGQKAVNEFSQIGAQMTAIGKDLSLKVTAPLTVIGAGMLKTAVDFDDSMRQVQAVTRATGGQFEALRQQAIDLGASTAWSASESAEAMRYLGMAGLSTNEILEATPQMLSLASAGAMELGAAADIATNVLSGFNLTISDLAHVSDVLAQAAASSNTSVEQMGQAMAYVGPVASSAGLSIEETTAAIQVMSNSGIQGTMAGTALRGALTNLLSPTTQAADVLATYGLTASDVNPEIHSLAEIIDTLGEAGLSTGDAMTLFGDRAGPAMLALIRTGGGGIRDYTAALEDCDGAAQEMAETMEGGAGGALRELEGAVETLSITFGDLIADALMPAIEGVTSLANWLSDLDEGTQMVIVTTALFAAATGPAIWGVGTLSSSIGSVITLYRAYRASALAATIATQGFTAALMANPAALAAVAIGAVALSLGAYYIAARQAESASKDLNRTGKSAIEQAKENVRAKQAEIDGYRATVDWHRRMRDEAIELGGLLNRLSEAYHQGEIDKYTEKVETLTSELGDLNDEIADLEDAEIDIGMAESQHDVDTLESSLSQILRLMDDIQGKDRTREELEDTEAIQEIRVRTSQKDLDEARAALKAWEKGGDNAYAIEFGSEAAREEHQRLIDEVTKAQVDLNRATREYNDTQEELNGLEEEFAEKESRVNEIAAEMNATLPDLKLTLDDLAKGQDHVNQKVREAIAMTPAGIEALRIINEFTASLSEAANTAPEAGTAVPVAVPGNEFYGKGYTPGYPEGFEVKEGGGLVRQPTGDRTTTPPAATVAPISPETYASYYPAAPLMPTITVEPISSDVLVSEEDLNKLRQIRNNLDSDATLTNEDLQKIYTAIREEIPEMGETHDQTVSSMIKKLDEYIKRQETAIANMQTLGGVGSVVVSPATGGGGQPERSAATGMPYVPRDMTVRVHQGEAIVPASQAAAGRELHIHMHNPVVRDDRDIDLLTNALYRRLQRA